MTTHDEVVPEPNIKTGITNMDIDQIRKGWEVEGSDGVKIGSVFSVSHPWSGGDIYLVTQNRHRFRTRELYIPRSAIADVGSNKVVLNVTKDEAHSGGWSQPPS